MLYSYLVVSPLSFLLHARWRHASVSFGPKKPTSYYWASLPWRLCLSHVDPFNKVNDIQKFRILVAVTNEFIVNLKKETFSKECTLCFVLVSYLHLWNSVFALSIKVPIQSSNPLYSFIFEFIFLTFYYTFKLPLFRALSPVIWGDVLSIRT